MAIEFDIQLETKNRFESIQHIRQCLQGDFPRLQQMLDKEREESALNSIKTRDYLNAKMHKLSEAMQDQTKIRGESEEQLVLLLKDMMTQIKDSLKHEQREREGAEDALLRLLEDTCVKLNAKQ